MVGHGIHHFSVGVRESEIVFKEVHVTIHMGHNELLVHERVGAHEVGIRRIVVDHQLIDLRQSILVTFRKLLIVHPEFPMRIARWKPSISCNHVHLIERYVLKDGVKIVQAKCLGMALQFPPSIFRDAPEVPSFVAPLLRDALCYSELPRSSNAVRTNLTGKQVGRGLVKQLLSNENLAGWPESLPECRNG